VVIERPSLTSDGLDVVWALARDRLERQGLDNRGRVRLPTDLSPRARRNLAAALGTTPRATVDLGQVEEALRRLGVGDDLPAALDALGFTVSDEPARRRAERAQGRTAREAARTEAAGWPEPWAPDWIDEVVRAGIVRGLDPDGAVELVRSVRRLLDHLHATSQRLDAKPVGRVELAAQVLGSAHALDTGRRLEAATTRALAHRLGATDPRVLWEQAGVHLDLTSGPVQTWNLPLDPSSRLAPLVTEAAAIGIPLHLTQLALRDHPVRCRPGAEVLVVENPRILEAAVQRRLTSSVVTTSGNPSVATQLLLRQLLDGGAVLRYHGDFDAAGLAICARMHAMGLIPWRMSTTDYRRAIADAEADGVELPVDPAFASPTPWDPSLATAFGERRLVVHEERLLPGLLDH
jgi:uncharacterized protein (TIGR02679 family)